MSNYPSQQGFPSQGYPQDGYPPARPRSGCGGCLGKFLIFLGVIFALVIAICCGGIFYVKSSVTGQPADVQAISDEIGPLHVPAPLEPVGGARLRVPLSGTLVYEGAIYADKDRKCTLSLVSFGEAFGQQFKDQLLKSFQSGQIQQRPADKGGSGEDLKDVKKTSRERTIQGDKAVFEISEGIGAQSGKQRIRVQGAFKGKSGPTIFLLDAEEDSLSRKKVEEMIDSIE